MASSVGQLVLYQGMDDGKAIAVIGALSYLITLACNCYIYAHTKVWLEANLDLGSPTRPIVVQPWHCGDLDFVDRRS